MTQIYLSLGSNVNPRENLHAALIALRSAYGPLRCSAIYCTPAVGFAGHDFLNFVVGCNTSAPPPAVMAELRQIEAQHGRHRGEARFADRTLDIDLLTYGDQISSTPPLPRADIDAYDFVLGPLAEIAGHEWHPVLRQTYAELWALMSLGKAPLVRVDAATEQAIFETLQPNPKGLI